jgi:hypothetical protein
MISAQIKLDELATSLRQLKNASAILYIIVTSDERNQTVYQSLKKVEGLVEDLNDEYIIKLYNKVFDAFLSNVPQQQIVIDDYFSFLQRIGAILNDATIQANEAHIALREAIGNPVIGSWRGMDL